MTHLHEPAASCHDCGLDYGDPGWIDAVVSDAVWLKISPGVDGSGLLCITCMARRLVDKGIGPVGVALNSGPFDFVLFGAKPR